MKDIGILAIAITGVLVIGLKFEGENQALKIKVQEQQQQIQDLRLEQRAYKEGVLSVK